MSFLTQRAIEVGRLGIATVLLWTGIIPIVAAESNRPHIVIYLADDLGIANLTAYHPESNIPTPEISRIAEEGCRFLDVHSASAVCTPSRYALLTGRYPFRSRLAKAVQNAAYEEPLLRGEAETIAGMLRRAGYRTAAYGKWHLGADFANVSGDGLARPGVGTSIFTTRDVDFSQPIRHLPVDHGFDTFFGLSSSINHDPYTFIENDHVVSIPTQFRQEFKSLLSGGPAREGWVADDWDDTETCPRILERAVADIGAALQSRPDQPLFIYYASPAPHFPWLPPVRAQHRTVRGAGGNDDEEPRHNDMVVMNDVEVGALRQALEDPNGDGDRSDSQFDRTLFIVTSDNGASEGVLPPYRGKKGTIYEGGHRVPFIVRWPGQVAPGTQSPELFGQQDLYATLAALTAVPVEAGAASDSRNVLTALRGGRLGIDEQLTQQAGGSSQFALRDGSWKIITGGRKDVELYDLSSDIGEEHDLASQHPERVRGMLERLGDVVGAALLPPRKSD